MYKYKNEKTFKEINPVKFLNESKTVSVEIHSEKNEYNVKLKSCFNEIFLKILFVYPFRQYISSVILTIELFQSTFSINRHLLYNCCNMSDNLYL